MTITELMGIRRSMIMLRDDANSHGLWTLWIEYGDSVAWIEIEILKMLQMKVSVR
jgi:hypothetical protein